MRLKELRHNNKQTQQEVAKNLNLSQVTYGRYELGTSEPSIETMCNIADYYNVSLDYLCERQYNNQIGYIPENKKELIKLILSLNDKNSTKLYCYAKGLLDGQE